MVDTHGTVLNHITEQAKQMGARLNAQEASKQLSAPDHERLLGLYNRLTLDSVGIGRDQIGSCFIEGKTLCINIHDSEDMTMTILCMSKGTSFGLHDHPKHVRLKQGPPRPH